jgi:hypothetical protein
VKLPFENMDLVPEHHELDVLVGLGPSDRPDEAQESAEAEAEEGDSHGG